MQYQDIPTTSDSDFIAKAVAHLKKHLTGPTLLGLSGGSTPKPIYEALGKEDIDWNNVTVFLVDERYCDAGSDDSNQKLVRETLLKHATIPEENLVFPDTSLPIAQCVQEYTAALKKLWRERLPDLVTLGMGQDGHIAALFPPLSDLAISDERLVLHTTTDRFAVHDRITLTLNGILAAEKHLFLLRGEEKQAVWNAMLASDENERRWPAKAVLNSGNATVIHLS